MPIRHFILGTAGHIDHGKSSLILALTGTDPDRLPEEKRRGMTIELGFAELDLEATDGTGDKLVVGVVDVPGHSDFVKNMVAGVGAIDLAWQAVTKVVDRTLWKFRDLSVEGRAAEWEDAAKLLLSGWTP